VPSAYVRARGTYADAVHVVPAPDRQLAEAYAQPAAGVTARPKVPEPAAGPLAQGKTSGETVHLRTVALMDLVTHLDYQSAVNQVLAAEKAAYARS
jgi:hypothetical protein